MGRTKEENEGGVDTTVDEEKLFFLVDFTLYPVYRIPRRRWEKLQTNEPREWSWEFDKRIPLRLYRSSENIVL